MRLPFSLLPALLLLFVAHGLQAESDVDRVRRAVERSTLNQPGTKPFHLKAELQPSRPSERSVGRSGEVEIWWAGPGRWRREVRSPEFRQVEIVDGARDWQKNDGAYFPEWLRELAVALIDPMPADCRPGVLERVKTAEKRH